MKKGEEDFMGHLVEDFLPVTSIPWALKRVSTDMFTNNILRLTIVVLTLLYEHIGRLDSTNIYIIKEEKS